MREDGPRGVLVGVTGARTKGARAERRTGVTEVARAALLPDLPARGVDGAEVRLGGAGVETALAVDAGRPEHGPDVVEEGTSWS